MTDMNRSDMKELVDKDFVRKAITKPGPSRHNCYDDGIHRKFVGLPW